MKQRKQQAQAYAKLAGWKKQLPRRKAPKDSVDRDNETMAREEDDIDGLEEENLSQHEEDLDSIEELLAGAEELQSRAQDAKSDLDDIEPTEYNEKARRNFLHESISDVIDAFTDVNNAIASTDWEISSRKSAGRTLSRKAGDAFSSTRRGLVDELKAYVKSFQDSIDELNNAEDADSFANAASSASQLLEDLGLDHQSFDDAYQEFTSDND